MSQDRNLKKYEVRYYIFAEPGVKIKTLTAVDKEEAESTVRKLSKMISIINSVEVVI